MSKSFHSCSARVVSSLVVALLFALAHPALADDSLVGEWQQVTESNSNGVPQNRGYIILNADGTGVIATAGVGNSPIESALSWRLRGKTLWMKYTTLRPETTTVVKFAYVLKRVGRHLELQMTKLPDPEPLIDQTEIDFYKVKT